MAAGDNNYVVGRGRLYFDKFAPQTKVGTGELYFGNTPELSTTQSEDTLDHYSSEGGLRVKDASVSLQVDSSGSFQCDNINGDNLALWFRGTKSTTVQAAAASLAETFAGVKLGRWLQLGRTTARPMGARKATVTAVIADAVKATGTLTALTAGTAADTITINGVTITIVAAGAVGNQVNVASSITNLAQSIKALINSNPTSFGVVATGAAAVLTLTAIAAGASGNAITLVETGLSTSVSGATLTGGSGVPLAATNYTLDDARARVFIRYDAPDVQDDDAITVEYSLAADSEEVVTAAGVAITGALRFIADNPEGENRDYFWPYVRLTPDGDLSLKGDEWQTVTFNFEILKLNELTERQYISKPSA